MKYSSLTVLFFSLQGYQFICYTVIDIEKIAGRDLSSTPFTTDTNRYSDAFSSQKSFEVTSPHFGIYDGPSADYAERYIHYVNYMVSAHEQGTAGYGAGDGEKELARLAITSQTGYQNFSKPSKSFLVSAALKWNPSDFAIETGETYSIVVNKLNHSTSLEQTWSDGPINTDTDGYPSHYDSLLNCIVGEGKCRTYLKKRKRLPIANWFALICGIGQYVIPLTEIQPGHENEVRYLPIDEAAVGQTIFFVGKGVTFTASYTGQLICFANDAFTEYWNNKGSINITVTRESWPPSSDAFYEEQYLPTCDSAIAVYANQGHYTDGIDHSMKCNPHIGGGVTERPSQSFYP